MGGVSKEFVRKVLSLLFHHCPVCFLVKVNFSGLFFPVFWSEVAVCDYYFMIRDSWDGGDIFSLARLICAVQIKDSVLSCWFKLLLGEISVT